MEFSRREWLLLLLTLASAILMNLAEVNARAGIALLAFQGLVSMANPLSALLALAASQVSADPADWPLTIAQTLVCMWPVQVLIRGKLRHLRAARPLIAVVAPLYLWNVGLTLLKYGTWNVGNPFDLALLVGVISATYVSELEGRYRAGLVAVLLGATPALLGYWFYREGLDFIGAVAADSVRGAAQVGIGRSDWNLVGVNIALAMAGLAAIALTVSAAQGDSSRSRRLMGFLAICTVGLGIPAVLGTMSRGCLINVVVCFVTIAAVVILRPPSVTSRRAAVALAILGFALLVLQGSREDVSERLALEFDFSRKQGTVLLSRDEVFKAASTTLLANPLLGETASTAISVADYGTAYASHNVFLDVGRGSGVVGILLYGVFFFFPPWALFRRRGWRYAFPFLIAYLSMFMTFLNLSVQNHKTYFLLWNLMSLAALMPTAPQLLLTSAVRLSQLRQRAPAGKATWAREALRP